LRETDFFIVVLGYSAMRTSFEFMML